MVFVLSLIFIIGALACAASQTVTMLIISRVILGLAVGGSTALVPVYLSEMAPTKIRGTLGTLNNLMIVTGILLAYIVNYIFTPFEAWRWMVGLAAVPAALLLIGIAFMPESPRWLVKRGREQEARQVMEMTHDKEDIAVELAEMKQGEAEKKESTLGLLKAKWIRPIVADRDRPRHLPAGGRYQHGDLLCADHLYKGRTRHFGVRSRHDGHRCLKRHHVYHRHDLNRPDRPEKTADVGKRRHYLEPGVTISHSPSGRPVSFNSMADRAVSRHLYRLLPGDLGSRRMGSDAGAVPVKRTRSRNRIYDIDPVGNQPDRFTGIPAYAERYGHRLGIRNILSHLPLILLLRRLHRS